MITKTNYTAGYIECEWIKNSPGNTVNSMGAEGYNFHYIHIKFDLATLILYIRAEVTDTAGSRISLAPLTVTKELLEDFGVVFTGNASQGDQFIAKIVDVMGMLGHWRKATRQGNVSYKEYGRIGSSGPNDKTYFYNSNEEEVKNLKKQLEEKDSRISNLEEIIQELKDDIETYKSMNQEC